MRTLHDFDQPRNSLSYHRTRQVKSSAEMIEESAPGVKKKGVEPAPYQGQKGGVSHSSVPAAVGSVPHPLPGGGNVGPPENR